MLLALLLVACGSAPSPVVAPPPPAAPPAPAGDLLKALDAPAEAFLQGIVTVEAGGVSLMPCDVAAASKLIDDTALLAQVVQDQGGSAYIEGRSATVGDDVHLTALHRALPGGADQCRRVSWQWTAKGAGPFWSLVVGARTMTMHQTGPSPHLEGDIAISVDSKGTTVFGQTSVGMMDALFVQKPCVEAGTGAWYSHTATVKLGGLTMSGCAAPGKTGL